VAAQAADGDPSAYRELITQTAPRSTVSEQKSLMVL
jgi:hypothetical protein